MRYTRVETLEEAFIALERPGARAYAGGTDLLVALHRDSPSTRSVRELVDIKGLDVAAGIQETGSALRVGALTTAAVLAREPSVARLAAATADAAARTSAPMLRARGTIGGNLVTPHPTPDVATALLTLGARVRVARAPDRIESLPVAAFLEGPFADGGFDAPALILAVEIPVCGSSAFEKVGGRGAFSRATASVGVAIVESRYRVVVGGVADRPFAARRISSALDRGEPVLEAVVREIDAHGQAGFDADGGPSAGASGRALLVAELVARARARAVQRAGEPPAGGVA